MTGAEQARDPFRMTKHIVDNCECRHASTWREARDEIAAAEAALRETREEANACRIEADEAMRDYEALEGVAFLALGHLSVVNRMPRVREAKALLDEALTGEGPKAALARAGEQT